MLKIGSYVLVMKPQAYEEEIEEKLVFKVVGYSDRFTGGYLLKSPTKWRFSNFHKRHGGFDCVYDDSEIKQITEEEALVRCI